MFGEFIRSKRLELRISLRQFVIDLMLDPSQWSLVESGRIAPPQEIEILFPIAEYLGVPVEQLEAMAKEDSEIVFVPYSDENLVKHLPHPLSFGQARNWSEEKLAEFAEWIRERI